ncbi:MAG: hypothetical protein ACRCUF_16565 [Aeromonas sobria]
MARTHFESKHLNLHQDLVTKSRKFGLRQLEKGFDPVIQVVCAGHCNQTHRVRISKLGKGQVFICNDRATRDRCHGSLPRAVGGFTRVITIQQAGKMAGVTYEDLGGWSAFKGAVADTLDGFLKGLTSLGIKKD